MTQTPHITSPDVSEPTETTKSLAARAFIETMDGKEFDLTIDGRSWQPAEVFNFAAHLARQAAWSTQTFGPGLRTGMVIDHIRKELTEIESAPTDIEEWVDLVILALDGAWCAVATPQQIIDGIVANQAKNEARTWPDWRTADPEKAIEHDRTKDSAAVANLRDHELRIDLSKLADGHGNYAECSFHATVVSPDGKDIASAKFEFAGKLSASVYARWAKLDAPEVIGAIQQQTQEQKQ